MTLTLLKAVTVREVLHHTLPAMNYISDRARGHRATLRHLAYALAYDRRLMREIDADKRTLDRPASPSLVALSGRLIDLSVTLHYPCKL
jgi:hypothetical protein